MNVRVSAVVCTYNRLDCLRKAIQSLVAQTLPKDQYEIIIVDNGSTDNTKQVVLQDYSYVPNLRYLYEPIIGVSMARNTGWRKAKGEIVAQLDDDMVADTEWLKMILRVFDDVQPTPVCVGGKVKPLWEISKPDWLPQSLWGYLSLLDMGDEPHWCDCPREWLVGCNIAYARKFLVEAGGFNVRLGRKGLSLAGAGEEVELFRKIKQRGEKLYYEPRAIAYHFIPKERLRKRWFIRRLYHEGVDRDILDYEYVPVRRAQADIKYVGKNILSFVSNVFKALFSLDRKQRILSYAHAAFYLGKVVYTVKRRLRLLIKD